MCHFSPAPLLAALIVVFVAGCGMSDMPECGQVTGTVTLDSQPLAGATIFFKPQSGTQSYAKTDAQGRYELTYLRDIKGAKVGSHTVLITTATEESPRERLPARYNRQSTLTAQVAPGENTFNFDLKSR
ncbi:MAG: carboxypeptidase regulatory-like domain-containing protein [Pirellulales bacterium]|nr:carboxypeptidase regulatory-like domain-containing protein [Pirellulales bacterium]